MIRDTTVRGRRLQYAEAGVGRPLVLLHAFPLTHAMWRHQLESPPPGWRIVAPDLRGFGGSDRVPHGEAPRSPGARSMADHAEDVAGLIDELELERPVIGGVSMGGYITFAVQRRTGLPVSGWVLADTRPDPDTDEARANRRRVQQLVLDKGPRAVADEMVPRLLGRTTLEERPGLAEDVRELIEGNSAMAIYDALDCLASRPDSTPQLATTSVPTLIVAGSEDVLTPVALHRAMRDAIPGSRLAIIEGAGHLANLEQPRAFNDALFTFLDALA